MKLKSLSDLSQLVPGSIPPVDPPSTKRHDGKGQTVSVKLDSKGRKGKVVTLIVGVHHNPTTLEDIARMVKQHCGAGGTVKEGAIEIQGDQRQKVKEFMTQLNYIVKS